MLLGRNMALASRLHRRGLAISDEIEGVCTLVKEFPLPHVAYATDWCRMRLPLRPPHGY